MIFKKIMNFFRKRYEVIKYYFINKPIKFLFLAVILATFLPIGIIYLIIFMHLHLPVGTFTLSFTLSFFLLLSFLLPVVDKHINFDKYFLKNSKIRIYDIKKITEINKEYLKSRPVSYILLSFILSLPFWSVFICFALIFIRLTIPLNIFVRVILGLFCFNLYWLVIVNLAMGYIMSMLYKKPVFWDKIRYNENENILKEKND